MPQGKDIFIYVFIAENTSKIKDIWYLNRCPPFLSEENIVLNEIIISVYWSAQFPSEITRLEENLFICFLTEHPWYHSHSQEVMISLFVFLFKVHFSFSWFHLTTPLFMGVLLAQRRRYMYTRTVDWSL